MQEEVTLTRFFPLGKSTLFDYFTKADLLEQWASPKDMHLKVPLMEARPMGKYRFEHRGPNGMYICNGYFKEYIQDQKLVQIDTVKNPEGLIIFQNIQSDTTFRELPGGTEVTITQKYFGDEKSLQACKEGWNQSLEQLANLLNEESAQIRKPESGENPGARL